MWEGLRNRLHNASTNLGGNKVTRKFTAYRPSPEEMVTQYVTVLITSRKKLIGTTENLTDDAMKTHCFTTLFI
jgi:hypothetical protein